MRNIKDELQNIILGDEPVGASSQLKKVQVFLRGNAETGVGTQKQQCLKSEETAELIIFGSRENLFYEQEIREDDFIASRAEQRVYRYDGGHVIKTNSGIFYEYWLDYFNSLLIHNYFFRPQPTLFLGLKSLNTNYMQ